MTPDNKAGNGAFRLDGKYALVTGGASGIGMATSRELVAAGAYVYIADLNLAGASALAGELGASEPLSMDVTSPESVGAAFEKIPRLDILVNNAGIGHVGDILRTELEDLSRLLDVNVKSMFLVTSAAFPLLLASHGSIVNIGSIAGVVGVKHRFAYCTSKGAVISMTRQIQGTAHQLHLPGNRRYAFCRELPEQIPRARKREGQGRGDGAAAHRAAGQGRGDRLDGPLLMLGGGGIHQRSDPAHRRWMVRRLAATASATSRMRSCRRRHICLDSVRAA
jgi:hypothetical protein